MIDNIRDLSAEIKNSLPQYLELHGHKPNQSGFITCLNPNHNDSTPSMSLTPDHKYVKCFGCGDRYDTLDVAARIHNYELQGEAFLEAVKNVADELKIQYKLRPPTAEEIKNSILYDIYRTVADAVCDNTVDTEAYTDNIKQHVKDRGWKGSVLNEMGIGALRSKAILNLSGLQKYIPDGESGWEFLREHDLTRQGHNIFDTDRLIFTLFDDRGRPVAFTSRKTVDDDSPKYLNTSASKVSIFDKSGLLYMYHIAKQYIYEESKEKIFVVEGQPDVVSAFHYGLKNIVALGTTSISESQIYLLKRSGATKIVFALDNDEPGRQATLKILTEHLKDFTGLKVYVKEFTGNAKDPGELINEEGIEAFYKAKETLAIDWLLEYHKNNSDEEKLAQLFIPIIATFPTAIERETLARKVAIATGFHTNSILEDVSNIINQKENTLRSKIKAEAEDLYHRITKEPERAIQLLDETRIVVQSIEDENVTDHLSGEYFASSILRFREENEDHADEFPGYNFPLMPEFAKAFDNDWSSGKMLILGGDENCLLSSTKVRVPEGWREIGNLNKGDLVMAVDGSWAQVQEVYRPGKKQLYRINFNDGTFVYADDNHLWGTYNSRGKYHVKTTEQLNENCFNLSIPYAEPYSAFSQRRKHKISPYFMGLLLGDGYLNQTPKLSFSIEDSQELLGYLQQELAAMSITAKPVASNPNMFVLSQNGTEEISKHHCANRLKDELTELGLYGSTCHNKCIPISYLEDGTPDNRLELLRGLLDSDGTIGDYDGTRRPKIEFYTVSQTLADNVAELVRSLGGRVTRSETDSRSRKNGKTIVTGTCYIVRITMPNDKCPFKLKRKADIWNSVNWTLPRRIIKSVEKTDRVEDVACISIDHESKLFVIQDYIVTHNTGKTSFSCFKMANMVLPEAENNLRGLYLTIDDSVQELYHKYICIFGKHETKGYRNYENGFDLEINHVVRPKYWGKILRDVNPQLEKDMLHAYQAGYNRLLQLARQERLIIIGVPNATNLNDLRRAVKRIRQTYSKDNLYAYIDNIHKLPLPSGDARLGFMEISNDIKNMAVEYEISIGGTLEYNNSKDNRGKGGRPTNSSLAESRAFKYDANAIVHMYNNLHVDPQGSPWWHEFKHPWYAKEFKAPIVEAIIGKNKISGDKSPHFFKFYPGSSWFEYTDRKEAIELAMLREQQSDDDDDDAPLFDKTTFGKKQSIESDYEY